MMNNIKRGSKKKRKTMILKRQKLKKSSALFRFLKTKRGLIFVVAFAVVGAVLLFKSFASNIAPTVGIAKTNTNTGYWLAQTDGGIVSRGDAKFLGSPKKSGLNITQPITDIAARPQGDGYWLLGGDGGVFAYGGAKYYAKGGDADDGKGPRYINGVPKVNQAGYYTSIISSPSGNGYWVISKLGTAYYFGDTQTTYKVNFSVTNYTGVMGTIKGVSAGGIVDADRTPAGTGLFMLDSNGKVYTVGGANELDGIRLNDNERTTGIAAENTTSYLITTSKGRVIPRGPGVAKKGDMDNKPLDGPMIGVTKFGKEQDGTLGYWLVSSTGNVFNYGKAKYYGNVVWRPVSYEKPETTKDDKVIADPDPAEKPIRVIAVGDIACNPYGNNAPDNLTGLPRPFNNGNGNGRYCNFVKLGQEIEKRKPNALMILGDWVYQYPEVNSSNPNKNALDDTYGKYKPWPALMKITYPVAGNHDYKTNNGNTTASEKDGITTLNYYGKNFFSFLNTHGSPVSSKFAPGANGGYKKEVGYYSYNLKDTTGNNNWHFVTLNLNDDCKFVKCAPGSKQANWLEEDLKNNNTKCSVALFHDPPGAPATEAKPIPSVGRIAYDQVANKVDITLHGDAHDYERITSKDSNNKTRSFIVGTGGISFGWRDNKSTEDKGFVRERYYNIKTSYLQLDLYKNFYNWSLINIDGTLIDQGSANCFDK